MSIHRLAVVVETTSVPVGLILTLILLIRVPSYLLLLRCNTRSTRTLPVDALTLRGALVHRGHSDSRVSRLRVLLLHIRGCRGCLMMAGLKQRHRGRRHAAGAAASTEERNHCPRGIKRLRSGWDVKVGICLGLRGDVRVRSGSRHATFSFSLRDAF